MSLGDMRLYGTCHAQILGEIAEVHLNGDNHIHLFVFGEVYIRIFNVYIEARAEP